VIASSCNDESSGSPTGDTIPDGPVTVADSDVSGCGGFEPEKRGGYAENDANEKLSWTFNSRSGTLEIIHSGLILNCCGVHTIDASFENGVLTIFEDDQPEPVGGRCRCICSFDFAVTLTGMKSGPISVLIRLRVDDDTTEHWNGTIDLGEGSGVILLSDSPE